MLGLPSHGYNPVAALDPEHEDFPDDALGLAEAMTRVEGREPHWAASAQDLICALIMFSRLAHPDVLVRRLVARVPDLAVPAHLVALAAVERVAAGLEMKAELRPGIEVPAERAARAGSRRPMRLRPR
ncbi:MAG: hypothetical protein ACREFO_20240 [Acetobacteraceae bacterium]